MEERAESLIRALMDAGMDLRITRNGAISVSPDGCGPWTVEIAVTPDGCCLSSCLARAVPPAKRPAVWAVCRRIENEWDCSCRLRDGDVLLTVEDEVIAPREVYGECCLMRLDLFRQMMDAALPMLVFALEGGLRGHVCLLLAGAYSPGGIVTVSVPNLEKSALFQQMKCSRFIRELQELGVIRLPEAGLRPEWKTEVRRESPSLRTEAVREPRLGRRRIRIPLLLLAAFTVLVLFLQIRSALFPCGLARAVIGSWGETLLYLLLTCWSALLVPPLMRGRGAAAKGAIALVSAALCTGLVILLNNLWHFLEWLEYYAHLIREGYMDSLLTAYRQLLVRDLAYRTGLGGYRYPAVFLIFLAVLLLTYFFRYSLRSRLSSGTLRGRRGSGVVFRIGR